MLEAGAARTGPAEWFAHRELLGILVRRDLAVRYSQTAIGVAWVLVQPIALAIALTLVLGGLVGVSTDGLPAHVFYLAGLVPWSFVAAATTRGVASLADQSRLVTRVYFPRVLLPLAAVLGPAVDACVGLGALAVVLVASGFAPSARWLVALPCLALLGLVALALSLLLAPLNARFRDVRHAIPFGLQLLLVASPVAYPSSAVPVGLRPFVAFHPIAVAIEGFRWALTGHGTIDARHAAAATALTLGLVLFGSRSFHAAERTIADVL